MEQLVSSSIIAAVMNVVTSQEKRVLANAVRALRCAWLQTGLRIVSYLGQTSWKHNLWCTSLLLQEANHYHTISLKKFSYVKC